MILRRPLRFGLPLLLAFAALWTGAGRVRAEESTKEKARKALQAALAALEGAGGSTQVVGIGEEDEAA